MSIHSRSEGAAYERWVIFPNPSIDTMLEIKALQLLHNDIVWREGGNELPALIMKAGDFCRVGIDVNVALYIGSPDSIGRCAAFMLYRTGAVVSLGRLYDVSERAARCRSLSWYAPYNNLHFVATEGYSSFADERSGQLALYTMMRAKTKEPMVNVVPFTMKGELEDRVR